MANAYSNFIKTARYGQERKGNVHGKFQFN